MAFDKHFSRQPEHSARIFLRKSVRSYWLPIRLFDLALRPAIALLGPREIAQGREPSKIMVFDPGVLGDMIMLAPFLLNLRAQFPLARVTLAGRPGVGVLLLDRGLVDELVEVQIPWAIHAHIWKRHNPFSARWRHFWRDLYALRRKRFDLAFAAGWSADVRGNLAIWLAGARRRVGHGYGGGKSLLTDVVTPDLSRPHVADRNLQLLEHLGLPIVTEGELLSISGRDQERASTFLATQGISANDLLIGIHPGAGSALREWGDERFAEVAKTVATKFGARILWFCDPVRPKPVPNGLDAVPVKLKFQQFAAVLSHCRLFICNDSGPMHVAAALKVPVVAVFGPQWPEWFGPRGPGHRVVIRNDIWCRPCGDQCRWKEPYCLRMIQVDQVMREVDAALTLLLNKSEKAEVRT